MIAARIIEPVIAVVIDAPADRSAWYQYNHDYLDYLERVVKYIDGHYATQATPDARLHAGTSAGGERAPTSGSSFRRFSETSRCCRLRCRSPAGRSTSSRTSAGACVHTTSFAYG
ncbi:MAG: hypothetical protein DMF89_15695 [Acidobacteria bacterium]|nr:MAG: hypothetical protein DMF89_15695 [Acidobacteriota bacterium]